MFLKFNKLLKDSAETKQRLQAIASRGRIFLACYFTRHPPRACTESLAQDERGHPKSPKIKQRLSRIVWKLGSSYWYPEVLPKKMVEYGGVSS